MTEQNRAIPSVADKDKALRMLRDSNQQLELTAASLDKLISMVEDSLSLPRQEQIGQQVSNKSAR